MQKEDTHPGIESLADSSVVRMLLDQRQKLLAEVNRIDRMLRREGLEVQGGSPESGPAAMTQSGRPRNAITKTDALLQVLKSASKPLSHRDLVLGIQNLGYVFASRNPSNTLNPLLYGDKKLSAITKLPAGFVLAERERDFTQNETPSL
jgi:hypothetical protein